MWAHVIIQRVLMSTNNYPQKMASGRHTWYWLTGRVAISESLDRIPKSSHDIYLGLSHFLNYCWGVLDQAQNGFGDVIDQIFQVGALTNAANVRSESQGFDQLAEIL